jgi:hypothetical protein
VFAEGLYLDLGVVNLLWGEPHLALRRLSSGGLRRPLGPVTRRAGQEDSREQDGGRPSANVGDAHQFSF